MAQGAQLEMIAKSFKEVVQVDDEKYVKRPANFKKFMETKNGWPQIRAEGPPHVKGPKDRSVGSTPMPNRSSNTEILDTQRINGAQKSESKRKSRRRLFSATFIFIASTKYILSFVFNTTVIIAGYNR